MDAERAVADLALSVAAARRTHTAEDLAVAREQRAAAEELLRGRDSPRARKLRTDLATASAALARLEAPKSPFRCNRRAQTVPAGGGIGQFLVDDEDDEDDERTTRASSTMSPGGDDGSTMAPLSSLTTPELILDVPALCVGEDAGDAAHLQQRVQLRRQGSSDTSLQEYKQLLGEAVAVATLTRELGEYVEAQSAPLAQVEANVELARDQQLAGTVELQEAAGHRVRGARRVAGLTGAAVGTTVGWVLTHMVCASLTAGVTVGAAGGYAVGGVLKRSWDHRVKKQKPVTQEEVEADVALASVPRNTAHMIAA